jgi:hypothetical protein
MEALAACHAVRLCKEVGIRQLVLEGDAKAVVTAVNEKEVSMHKHGHLIEEIKFELQAFSGWKCCYVSRNLNMATHGLAKAWLLMVWPRRPVNISLEGLGIVQFREQSVILF